MNQDTTPTSLAPITIEEEHAFWLDILNDHVILILNALPSDEKLVLQANIDYKEAIAGIRSDIADAIDRIDSSQDFAAMLTPIINDVIRLKKQLLSDKLRGLEASIEPTTINHMLNEVDEYASMLQEYTIEGKVSPKDPLHHHKLWLNDAAGHLAFIMARLDPVEKSLKKAVKEEKKRFGHLYKKTLEFIGYLRADEDFPQLNKLDREAAEETLLYLGLISDIAAEAGETAHMIPAAFLEHAHKEQEYYLRKLRLAM